MVFLVFPHPTNIYWQLLTSYTGLSLPVSVNELQRKLEEEVDRRRGEWEQEQGHDISKDEVLTETSQKALLENEGKTKL